MHPITESTYLLKMMSHVLSHRAKILNISVKNKSEWRNLSHSIRDELKERYRTASSEEILNDIAFSKKPIPIPPSSIDIDKNVWIINTYSNIPSSNLEWASKIRIQSLQSPIAEETMIAAKLRKKGINVFQKVPFYTGTRTYFTHLFLPDYKTIIEIVREGWSVHPPKGFKTRLSALRKFGYNIKYAIAHKIRTEAGMDEFINSLSLI